MRLVLILIFVFNFDFAHAWGRRGHSTVGATAAYLISAEVGDNFYKSHSYDLGYYANTPDFFWKEKETFERESKQHYMNKEIFDHGLKDHKGSDPYELSREEFEAKFPHIPFDAGRGFWRVRELNELLKQAAEKLASKDLSKEERFGHQANWLLAAGVIGHYIGDMSQPLHVTENFDGQLSEQKGIHSFFEDAVVDELYGDLEKNVLRESKFRWKQFHKKNANVPLLDLLKQLTANSHADLGALLKTDKRIGRDLKKAKAAYQKLIEERLTVASLYLAEIWVRQTKWTPDNNRFFNFFGRPPYIEPGAKAALPPVPTPQPKKP